MSSSTAVRPEIPFLGLHYFDEENETLFFGRDEQLRDLLAKLAGSRFVTVIGSSGSGKSSLARAGLIPALCAGFFVAAGQHWRIVKIRPGSSPLLNLAQGMEGVFGTTGAEVTLRRGPLGLVEAALQSGLGDRENLLVMVDQFEEIFRYQREAKDPQAAVEESSSFVKLLLAATARVEPAIFVLVTMRSDYLGACAQFRDLPERINTGLYLIPRMRRDQLEDAITGPAAVAGARFSPPLVQQLLNDAGEDPDQLPVLQHALLRAWLNWKREKNESQDIDFRHYDATGGVREGLDNHAEEIYGKLGEGDKKIAEVLFKCLTERDPSNNDIRRPCMLREIADVANVSPDDVRRVADVFRAPGVSFLNPTSPSLLGDDTVLDITHESLLRKWKQLCGWVDVESKSAQLYRRVADSAERNSAGREGPWRDPQLQLALDERETAAWNKSWAERYRGNFDQAMAFLDLSRGERDRESRLKQKQQRRMRTLTVALFVISALFLAVPAYLLRYAAGVRKQAHETNSMANELLNRANMEIDRAHQEAKQSQSLTNSAMEAADERRTEAEAANQHLVGLRLGNQALNEFRPSADGLARSGILAVESLKTSSTFEGRSALAQVLRLIPPVPEIIPDAHHGPVRALAFSRDGRWMASGGEDGTFILWDLTKGMEKRVLDTQVPTGPSAFGLAFSYDGRWLAGGGMGAIRIWDIQNPGGPVQVIGTQGAFVRSISFSPDEEHMAAALRGFGVKLFHRGTSGWEEEKSLPTDLNFGRIDAVTFMRNGMLAMAGKTSLISHQPGVWFTGLDLRKVSDLAASEDSDCRALALSQDLFTFAALCDRGIFVAHAPSAPVASLMGAGGFSVSYGIAVGPDGRFVAAADNGGVVHVFGNPITEETFLLMLPANSVAFRPDGEVLAAGLESGSIALWPASRGTESIRVPFDGVATGLAFSTDERLLATGEDGTVHLLDVSKTDNIRLLQSFPIGSDLGSPTFGPDGRFLAVLEGKTVRLMQSGLWKTVAKYDTSGDVVPFFSPDGRFLLLLSSRAIRRFALGRASWQQEPAIAAEGNFNEFRLSPDGRWLATLQEIHPAPHALVYLKQVWDVATGKEIAWNKKTVGKNTGTRPPQGGSQKLIDDSGKWRPVSRSLSPDGQWFVDVSRHGPSLVLKETSTGREVAKLEHDGEVLDAAFSPKGRWLATSSQDGTVRLWPLQPKDMIERACKLLPRNLTTDEWKDAKIEGPYRKTCPNLPVPAKQ